MLLVVAAIVVVAAAAAVVALVNRVVDVVGAVDRQICVFV